MEGLFGKGVLHIYEKGKEERRSYGLRSYVIRKSEKGGGKKECESLNLDTIVYEKYVIGLVALN